MKKSIILFILMVAYSVLISFSCTKQASNQLVTEQSKKGGNHSQTEVVSATTLTHNADGTFIVDYGGATNVIQLLLRSGDSLYSNGNLYPKSVQQLIPAPVDAFSSYITPNTYYQAIVVTGTWETDANGVLGANWVFTYTNVVQ